MIGVKSLTLGLCLLGAEAARVRTRNRKVESESGSCADPISSVVGAIDCISNGDVSCANAGYSRRGFDKYHNGIKAATPPFPADDYWGTAMKFSSFTTWVNFQENIGKNQVEVRYIDNIKMSDGREFGLDPSRTYPFNASFKQYEHAIVTVDDDCKVVRWDQYGDNKEQNDVDDATNAMIAQVGIPSSAEHKSTSPVASSVAQTKTASTDSELESSGGCDDPLAAINRVMNCIKVKNTTCATQGYNWLTFNKYHNGKNAGVQLFPFDVYWQYALMFSTLTLDYDFSRNVDGSNSKASVRYVEKVEMSDGSDFDMAPRNDYPFNVTMFQYEHALVQVDNDCKIIRWDQYGDKVEQAAVDDMTSAMFSDQGVRCFLNLAFPWQC